MAAEIAPLGPKLRLRDLPAHGLWELEREFETGWRAVGGFATRRLLSQIAQQYGVDDGGTAILRNLPRYYEPNAIKPPQNGAK